MESTPGHTTANSPRNLDAVTMRIHSRARIIQSRQRMERLRRETTSLGHLLDAARSQQQIEETMLDHDLPSGSDPRSDRDALIDLAAQGERQLAKPARPVKPGPSLRHLQAVSRWESLDELPPIDADATSEELDLRDRDALIDLRRDHDVANRHRMTILRDTQPRSAATDRRWG